MEFISTRDFKINATKYLNRKSDIVVTKYGKPVALVTPIREKSIEEILLSIRAIIKSSGIKKTEALRALEEARDEIYG